MSGNNAHEPRQTPSAYHRLDKHRHQRPLFAESHRNHYQANRHPSLFAAQNLLIKFITERARLIIAGLTVITIVIAVIFMISNRHSGELAIVPIIEAERGPIKIRPQESSQPVLHSEKTIYSVLSPQELPAKVENLLSEPEKPQPQNPSLPEDFMRGLEGDDGEEALTPDLPENTIDESYNDAQSAVMPVPSASSSDPRDGIARLIMENSDIPLYAHDSGEDIEDGVVNSEPVNINIIPTSPTPSIFLDEANDMALSIFPTPVVKSNMAIEKLTNQVEAADIKVNSSKIIKPKIKPNVATAQKIIYRAQVCSAISKKAAEQAWSKIYKRAPQLFSGFKPIYEKVDLGAKAGIRYRVQIGQFNQDSIKKFCQKLKIKGFDCAPVRQNVH